MSTPTNDGGQMPELSETLSESQIESCDRPTPGEGETPETDAALRELIAVGIKYGFSESLLHEFAKDAQSLERRAAAAEMLARAGQGSRLHMIACRALLSVPSDEVLYVAIEDLLKDKAAAEAECGRLRESMGYVNERLREAKAVANERRKKMGGVGKWARAVQAIDKALARLADGKDTP